MRHARKQSPVNVAGQAIYAAKSHASWLEIRTKSEKESPRDPGDETGRKLRMTQIKNMENDARLLLANVIEYRKAVGAIWRQTDAEGRKQSRKRRRR